MVRGRQSKGSHTVGRSSSLRLSIVACVLMLLCLGLSGCATGNTSAKSATLPPASVHRIAPRGTVSPRQAGGAGVLNHPLASTGCGKPSPVPAGTSVVAQLLSGGLQRIYRVHVPRGYTPRLPFPLVLNFHGHGSNGANQERMTGFSLLADRHGFLVVYPQGTLGPDGWTGWASGGPNRPTSNDVLFVSDLLTKMQEEFCVDPLRIFATGFSNGGAMTAVLACHLAGRIAAFAPVSGSYYPQADGCLPGRPVSVLEFHGSGDTVVPYGGRMTTRLLPVATWLQQWVSRDSCADRPSMQAMAGHVTVYTWTDCAAGAVVEHYRIAGWGHRWPALPATSPQEADGGGVPIASVLIWKFFEAHPLPTPAKPVSGAPS